MKQSDPDLILLEEFAFLATVDLLEFRKVVEKLNVQQIHRFVQALSYVPFTHKQEKLIALFQTLKETSLLESFGQALSSKQFLELLKALSDKKISVEKLSPVLVGLKNETFFQCLPSLSKEQLELLKQESALEPLQYHLTLFTHECESFNHQQAEDSQILRHKINELELIGLTYQHLTQIKDEISALNHQNNTLLQAINHALTIIWNTNRVDLIERFTQLKEHIHHRINEQIGLPATQNEQATGLFAELETKLFGLFKTENVLLSQAIELKDEDLATEGLAKLSIWYLKDYWELGLLPSITHAEKLELDDSQYNEETRSQHKQHLFSLVKDNLRKVNLATIADLKRAQIFSKPMLKEYLQQFSLKK